MKRYTIYNDRLLANEELKATIIKHNYVADYEQLDSMQAWIITYYDISGLARVKILQSYNTLVCAVDFAQDKIYCNGTYSPTTARQITRFCNNMKIDSPYYYKLNLDIFKKAIKPTLINRSLDLATYYNY